MLSVITRLPRLLTAQFSERERLRPTALSYQLRLNAISSAAMTLAEADAAPHMHDWIELYTARGSIGLYRVTGIAHTCLRSTSYTLMHGIDTLSDSLWRARDYDFSGTVAGFLSALLSWQTTARWQLGTVQDTGNYKKSGISYSRLSDLLQEMADSRHGYYLAYDFSTAPWTLHFLALPTQPAAEWRLSRNVRSCQVNRNDADLCTRLHMTVSTTTTSNVTGYTSQELDGRDVPVVGTGDTISTTSTQVTTYNNTAAQAVYGVVEKTADIDSADVPDAAAWAQEFLSERAEPRVQITIDGYELARLTGSTWDAFDLGKMTRCCMAQTGETLSERVVGITYPDPLGAPERVTVELANRLPKFSESLGSVKTTAAKAESTAKTVKRGGGSSNKDQEHWSQVVKKLEQSLDGTGIRNLWETGIVMDAQSGARLYSLWQGEGVSASGVLKVMNDDINARATKTTVDALGTRVGQAEVDINAAEAAITLKANQSTVDSLTSRVSSAEIAIDGANAQIALKASQTTVDALGSRVTQAEIDIDGAESAITLKANQVSVDALSTKITNLTTGVTTATQLSTNYLYAYQNFNYKNVSCTLVNKTVKGSDGNNIVIHYIGYET